MQNDCGSRSHSFCVGSGPRHFLTTTLVFHLISTLIFLFFLKSHRNSCWLVDKLVRIEKGATAPNSFSLQLFQCYNFAFLHGRLINRQLQKQEWPTDPLYHTLCTLPSSGNRALCRLTDHLPTASWLQKRFFCWTTKLGIIAHMESFFCNCFKIYLYFSYAMTSGQNKKSWSGYSLETPEALKERWKEKIKRKV